MRLHRAHVTKKDKGRPSPGKHRVTGSSISSERKKVASRHVVFTVVTLTCSCGRTVTGQAQTRSAAEDKARLAFNKHT